MGEPVEYSIEPARKWSIGWKELWQYRELFYFFTWRDIKVKYKQTFLGFTWVILQPALTVLTLTLFFQNSIPLPNSTLPYPVFLFSGLILWNLFSSSVNTAGNSMITHAPIIKKIYFPRLIIPISSVLVALIDFLMGLMLFIALLLAYSVPVNVLQILMFWPIAFLTMIIGTIGISLLLSALSVKYRDFKYVIPFGLQLGLFISPVIYDLSIIKQDWVRLMFSLNPMYAPITLFRVPLDPMTRINEEMVLLSTFSGVALLVTGLMYFKRTEAYFADIA